ncbi:MAG TPA: hypothetical protein VMG38_03705 [Trebonia sp.]|nr:hypothetical protein [Trebonia sp.]
MPDQIMTAIAAALAGKTADAVFSGSKDAFSALVRLIQGRFTRDDRARATLESARKAPDDPAALEALAREVDRLAAVDREVSSRISQLGPLVAPGSVVNTVTGTVNGPVFQARDIQGGIHISNP